MATAIDPRTTEETRSPGPVMVAITPRRTEPTAGPLPVAITSRPIADDEFRITKEIGTFSEANARTWDEIARNDPQDWKKHMGRLAHDWVTYWRTH